MSVTSLAFVMAMPCVMILKVALCAYAIVDILVMDIHAQVSFTYRLTHGYGEYTRGGYTVPHEGAARGWYV